MRATVTPHPHRTRDAAKNGHLFHYLLLLLQHIVCVNTITDNSGFHDITLHDALHHASCVDVGVTLAVTSALWG